MPSPQLIHFDYPASPYAYKINLLLHQTSTPYTHLAQPPLLPRPDLEALGVTYRRIPLLAIGRDIYCDSGLITSVILEAKLGKTSIRQNPSDKAYAAWGDETFRAVLPLIPRQALSPAFVQDRATIFPQLQRPDMASLAPSAEAELKSRLAWVEEVFLKDAGEGRPWSEGGAEMSAADVHVVWALKWALVDLGTGTQRKGLGREVFPKVWGMIDALPKPSPGTLGSEAGVRAILDAELFDADVRVEVDDSLGFAAGTEVEVESLDATPGAHPQAGKLVGTRRHEVVIETGKGVRVHFPRVGYVVREAGTAGTLRREGRL